jgi:hypothetical protein
VADDGDAIGIGPGGTRNCAAEHVVEQEAGVRNAVGDEASTLPAISGATTSE